MKILFVNQCYWPDHVSTAQHLTDLAEGLAGRGHDVTVLCSRNPYTGGGAVFPKEQHHNGVQIYRVATLGYGKKSGLRGRMLDYLSFHLMALLKGLRLPAPEIVVTLTSPLLVGALGWLLAVLKRAKHVHWCMDLFPDTGVLFGLVKENGLAHRVCTFFTRRYLRSASGIVAISPYMLERIQRYGVGDDASTWSPCGRWARTCGRFRDTPTGLSGSTGSNGKFILMFSGNLELGGDMDTLVGALAALRGERDILLVMISEGPRLEKFRAMTERASLSNVLFLPYQDRDRLAYSLSAGDVHIVTNKKGLGGLRVPGKTYGVLAVGRPIVYIGEPRCEVADLVRDHQLGFVIEEGDVPGLVRAIRQLRDDPALRQEISARPEPCSKRTTRPSPISTCGRRFSRPWWTPECRRCAAESRPVPAQRKETSPMNEPSCHGVVECLRRGSSRWIFSPLAKPWQKLRSYLVWHIENLGVRRGLRTACLGLWRRARHSSPAPGRGRKDVAGEVLGLQPGEMVEVKSVDEILATLDGQRRHKGLLWMTGMAKYCGQQYRVYRRVERITLESNGEQRTMKNTVLLEGVMCDGREFGGCDRSCFHFWREAWLRRIHS